MTREPERSSSTEDEAIESLLGEIGARTAVPADAMAQVRESVHAEWRAVLEQRQRRRRAFAYGLAASGLCAMLVTLAVVLLIGNGSPVATVARVVGTLEASDGTQNWRRLSAGEAIEAGEIVRVGVDGRAALMVGSGVQIRLDSASLIELVGAERVALSRGAIYVDADPAEARDSRFSVATGYGTVAHVGTQFLVRAHGRSIEISVREGRVRLRNETGEQLATAGERLRLTDAGVDRERISLQDPAWEWALRVAPEFAIEGVRLADFLRWAARETGRKLVYTNQEAAQAAEGVVLHGSTGALPPDAALAAVLSTTKLVQVSGRDDSLTIALRAATAESAL